jgi:predicted HAD superfamily Cof-like phosphohydrolase
MEQKPDSFATSFGNKIIADSTSSESFNSRRYELYHQSENILSTIIPKSEIEILMSINDVDKFHSYLAKQWHMTNADKVKQFTEESAGKPCPNQPQIMSKEAAIFLVKMIISEAAELLQTVCQNNDEVLSTLHNCVGVDLNTNYVKPTNPVEIIAEQNDALVDSWYYSLNAASKNGVNLSSIFDVVHAANMSKKWSDGQFHRRDDGKVIKPDDWKEPDVIGEINRQMNN